MKPTPPNRTGVFELFVEIGPDATKAERDFKAFQLLNEMTWKIGSLVEDGRGYELRARIVGAWEPSEIWPAAERLRLTFSLVLLDPSAAEVGEWTKGLNREVPDDAHFISFGEGYGKMSGWRFQRGELGWCRVE